MGLFAHLSWKIFLYFEESKGGKRNFEADIFEGCCLVWGLYENCSCEIRLGGERYGEIVLDGEHSGILVLCESCLGFSSFGLAKKWDKVEDDFVVLNSNLVVFFRNVFGFWR